MTPSRSRSPTIPRSAGCRTTPTAVRSKPRTRSSSTTRRWPDAAHLVADSQQGGVGSAVVRACARLCSRKLQPDPRVLVDGAHLGPKPARSARTRAARPLRHAASPTPTGRHRGSAGPAPTRPARGLLVHPQDGRRRRRVRSCAHASTRRPGITYELHDQRCPPLARPVVRVSRRAVLRDDRHHGRHQGGRTERVRVRDVVGTARPGPAGIGTRVDRTASSIDHADGTREVDHDRPDLANTHRPVASKTFPATTKVTSSSTSTNAGSRPAGPCPGSTTRRGPRPRCWGRTRRSRSRICSRRARTSSSSDCSRSRCTALGDRAWLPISAPSSRPRRSSNVHRRHGRAPR